MDKTGFRTMLESRQVPVEKMEAVLAMAERFDLFLEYSGLGFTARAAWAFSELLIAERQNTEENYLTLARYALYLKNHALFVALLELLDGGEVHQNLYRRVAEQFGEEVRDAVFVGTGVAPYGTPSTEKPRYMIPVIEQLIKTVGEDACRVLLSPSLRDLPEEAYQGNREMYRSSNNIDEYLLKKKQHFLKQLETCRKEDKLFFAQEITDAVLEYIRHEPEIGGGVRVGNIIYETKIPYMTKEYLFESDLTLKRYYYCHCPWVREAVRRGEAINPVFCNCSAGFHKKPWEAIFGQTLHAEVLESVLQGDLRCRFAIHLPERFPI